MPRVHRCRCGEVIKIYTHLLARYCECPGCHTYYSIDGERLEQEKSKKTTDNVPWISVGSKCRIEGAAYIVTAYVVKRDVGNNYEWSEYTLYNPIYGYKYLSEYHGHWMMVALVDYVSGVDTYDTDKLYDGTFYKLYGKYKCKVVTAIGEFAGDVYSDSRIRYYEFIAPPRILIHEVGNGESHWLHGSYMQPSEVSSLFGLKAVPERRGIGMIEPQTAAMPFLSVVRVSVVAALLIVIVQLWSCIASAERLVYTYSSEGWDSAHTQIVTPPFDLTESSKNLELCLQSDIDNSWVETDVTLVNEKTAEDVDLVLGAEYYHGYSDGESWSEGATSTTSVIEQVPAGRYHLLITPSKDPAVSSLHYDIQVKRDVPLWGSFFLSLLLLGILPVVQFYRERSFEKDRWIDSDYSPFPEEED